MAADAPAMAPLLERFIDVGTAAGPTFPAKAPAARIDFLLVSRGVKVARAWVEASTASDHAPVAAELEIAG